jgi:hypothetical protein
LSDDEGERSDAIRQLSEYESTLPPGEQAFFRLKMFTVIATPMVVALEQEIAKGTAPREPFEIASGLVDALHQGFAAKKYGRDGDWLARAVPIEMTYNLLNIFLETELDFARKRNEEGP